MASNVTDGTSVSSGGMYFLSNVGGELRRTNHKKMIRATRGMHTVRQDRAAQFYQSNSPLIFAITEYSCFYRPR